MPDDRDETIWSTVGDYLASLPWEVENAAYRCAILHWFNLEILEALVGSRADTSHHPVLAPAEILSRLRALPFVEDYPSHGHSFHDVTRRVVCDRLWRQRRDLYREVSSTAAAYHRARIFAAGDGPALCSDADPAEIAEWVYHSLVPGATDGHVPREVGQVLEQLWDDHRTGGPLVTVGRAIDEQLSAERVAPGARPELELWLARAALAEGSGARAEGIAGHVLAEAMDAGAGAAMLRAEAAACLGDSLAAQDRWAEALGAYARSLDAADAAGAREGPSAAGPGRLAAHVLLSLGVALARLDRHDQSLGAYDTVVRRYGASPDVVLRRAVAAALVGRATALTQLGRDDEAISASDELIARYWDAPDGELNQLVALALLDRGTRLDARGRADEALASFDEAIRRSGARPQPHMEGLVAHALASRADLLRRIGRDGDAVAAADEVVQRFGDSAEPTAREHAARALAGQRIAMETAAYLVPALRTLRTEFTLDVLGRYVCNSFDEALAAAAASTPGVRPFDVMVLGGGTFGLAFAEHLFHHDRSHRHRILVLEAGPFVLPDHRESLELLDLAPAGDTTIAHLRENPPETWARNEVWGLAWHSRETFPGLAYCLGGRSLYWDGWAPRPLPSELAPEPAAGAGWPATVVDELTSRHFETASRQLGTTDRPVAGLLQQALGRIVLAGISGGRVTDAIDPAELPGPSCPKDEEGPGEARLLHALSAPLAGGGPAPSHERPLRRYCAMPPLIRVARLAQIESAGDDVDKRLMVVPNVHVVRLVTDGGRVTHVETNFGAVPVPSSGVVVLAMGTIESTRLALLSFPDAASAHLIGQNLVANLRSRLTIRVPSTSLSGFVPEPGGVDRAALLLRGRHGFADGKLGHFHVQVLAEHRPEGPGTAGKGVVVTLTGLGEMERLNPENRVSLDPEPDEYQVRRAFVSLSASASDLELWAAMDAAMDDVVQVVAGGLPYEVLGPGGFVAVPGHERPDVAAPHASRRDSLGSTHCEAGTLWMGDEPAASVTDVQGRLHGVENVYAVGPAVVPRAGSCGPMLTGIALSHRLAEHLAPSERYVPEAGFTALFDGIDDSAWRMGGAGRCCVVDGALEVVPDASGELGLLWHAEPAPPDFVLRLEWLRHEQDSDSGVLVRFPDPRSKRYHNQAWVAAEFGFEVQIDESGWPDGNPIRKTGAINGVDGQQLVPLPARLPGEWNDFEIRVRGQLYVVLLNGVQVTSFRSRSDTRGAPGSEDDPRYIGFQLLRGRVAFRKVRVRAL